MEWIRNALIAIGVVGVSDILRKLASQLKDPYFANLIFQAGSFAATLLLYLLFSKKVEMDSRAVTYAFFGGTLISVFTLFTFKALAGGPGVSTVMPVIRIGGISLVVLLGIVFLREQMNYVKILGLFLSFIGVYLLFSQ